MTETTAPKPKPQAWWLVYVAAVLAGAILLGDALGVRAIQQLTARLGIALLFSAVALLVGNGRPSGFVAAAIIWVAVIITFFV